MRNLLLRLDDMILTCDLRAKHYSNIPSISADYRVMAATIDSFKELLEGKFEYREGTGWNSGFKAWYLKEE